MSIVKIFIWVPTSKKIFIHNNEVVLVNLLWPKKFDSNSITSYVVNNHFKPRGGTKYDCEVLKMGDKENMEITFTIIPSLPFTVEIIIIFLAKMGHMRNSDV